MPERQPSRIWRKRRPVPVVIDEHHCDFDDRNAIGFHDWPDGIRSFVCGACAEFIGGGMKDITLIMVGAEAA